VDKVLKKPEVKDDMGEIVKKVLKKLYKDLSLQHPYIIDRIKV
jgi:galactose-1-phosphate uridylyltransferase